jgi:predicted nucleic acid-binding protein
MVVSNTSPLCALASIGRVELLRDRFGQIIMPSAVQRELETWQNTNGLQLIRTAISEDWLKVHEVMNAANVKALIAEQELDAAEAEAIVLAGEFGVELVLLDEAAGRKAARKLGLDVTGVLGVLLAARRSGKIRSIGHEIERLQQDANFYISDVLVKDILRRDRETK